MRPYISEGPCEKCGDCIAICPYDVFRMEGDYVAVACPEDCIECAACVENCPHEAILMGD